MNAILCFKLFQQKVFVHRILKLLNFLMDSVLSFKLPLQCTLNSSEVRFRVASSLYFKTRLSGKPFSQQRPCTQPRFESESFWNSEVAYCSPLPSTKYHTKIEYLLMLKSFYFTISLPDMKFITLCITIFISWIHNRHVVSSYIHLFQEPGNIHCFCKFFCILPVK